MTITFACPCGKLLKSRAENAGRRTKCPRCGSYLVIPHISVSHDEMSASGSEPELLSQSDFSDVEYVVKVATAQASAAPPAPSLLELDPGPSQTPITGPRTPPNIDLEPELETPLSIDANDASTASLDMIPIPAPTARATVASTNSDRRDQSSIRVEPWFFAVLEWVAYLCMGLGALQFAVVFFAIALGSDLDVLRTFALALVLLIVTLGLGGLALVGLDIARSLRRAARSFSDPDAA